MREIWEVRNIERDPQNFKIPNTINSISIQKNSKSPTPYPSLKSQNPRKIWRETTSSRCRPQTHTERIDCGGEQIAKIERGIEKERKKKKQKYIERLGRGRLQREGDRTTHRSRAVGFPSPPSSFLFLLSAHYSIPSV